MASYAHQDGHPIEAGEVEQYGGFTCIKCKESVHHRSSTIRSGYIEVRACFVHNESSPECELYLGGHEVPPGYIPKKKIKERFQYDVNHKRIKIQSQTIDNVDSKIFLNKKQDFFNLSMMINISIESESTDNPDGKIKIKTLGGLREILIKDIENMSGPIQAFDIDSNFTQDNIELEGTIPPFISNVLEDNINFQERDAWIFKDPYATGLLFNDSEISLNYDETYALLIYKDINNDIFKKEFLQAEKFDDPNFTLYTFDIYSENTGRSTSSEPSYQELLEKLLGSEYRITWNRTPKIKLIDPAPIRIEKGTIYIDPDSKKCIFKLQNENDIDEFYISVISTDIEDEQTHDYKEKGNFIEIDVSNAQAVCITGRGDSTNTYYKIIKKNPKPNTYLGITILINGESYNLLDQNLKNHLKLGTDYAFSESIVNRQLDILSKVQVSSIRGCSYDGKEIDGGHFGNYQVIDPKEKSSSNKSEFSPSQEKIVQWLKITAGIINQNTDLDTIEKEIIKVYGKHSEFENHINSLKR